MGVFVQKKFSESSSEKGEGGRGGGGDNFINGGGRWSNGGDDGTRLRLTSECTLLEKKERKKQISFI